MKPRSISAGFGLLQVMIGTVVLGIFAMVFVRKAQNRADISLLTELITYRDQVLDYYSAVVQSRTAWQCTRKCDTNPPPTPPSPGTGFNLYDGDADCQASCPTPPPTLRLLATGWRFSRKDNNFTFEPPPQSTSPSKATHPFFVQANWQRVSSSHNSVKVTLSIKFDPSDDWKKENTTMNIGSRERVFYMNRTPYKNCSDGLAARFSGSNLFYDDGGTGTGVARYAGDTAVVEVDATTGLVKCWNSPLVIPPCYRSTAPFDSHRTSDSTGLYFIAADRCDFATKGDQGLCPKVGSGTTGITHFDKFTGISHCGVQHIFIKNHTNDIDCGASGSGGLVGIDEYGRYICSNATTGAETGVAGTGVDHNEGSECQYGIKGWDSSGDVVCANAEGNVTHDYGVNISFHDGYWVGDKGDKGCEGDKITSCNCCTYPQHCTSTAWISQPLGRCSGNPRTCQFRGNSTLQNDFRGCQNRECGNSHGCDNFHACNRACGNYYDGGGGCLEERYDDRQPIRDYEQACSDCKDRNSCDSKLRAYYSCRDACDDPDTPENDCDSDDCDDEWDTYDECDDDCDCGNPPTPFIKDCKRECLQGDTADDSNYCATPPLVNNFFGTTQRGPTCLKCEEYNRRCATAERKSREYKDGDTPTKTANPSCSSRDSRMSCP